MSIALIANKGFIIKLFVINLFFMRHSNICRTLWIRISKKTIEYHDPNNNWNSFKGELTIEMITPDNNIRISTVANLPNNI
jgi:hypothetical protein